MNRKSIPPTGAGGCAGIALATLALLAPLPAIAGTYGGGKGSEAAPYLIAHPKHLQELGKTSSDWDKHFRLDADIDLTGVTIELIGDKSIMFTGSFDGDGHVLANLTQKRPTQDCVGLFGFVGSGGTVMNLGLVEAIVTGRQYVGTLVGMTYDSTIIFSCFATGSVSGESFVGGLVGVNKAGSISNCFATCSVAGGSSVGGLVSTTKDGLLTACYSAGPVQGDAPRGGLVAENTGKVLASFWDVDTSGRPTSAGGTGLPTADMMKFATFKAAGWDFSTPVWTIVEDVDYPQLAVFPSGPPQVTIDPLTHDFGNVQAGESSTVIVTLGNEGGSALTLTDVLLLGDPVFAIDSPTDLPGTLMPGQWVDLVVSCTPIGPGWMAGTLEIHSDDPDEPVVTASLQGFGTLSELPSDEQVEAIVAYVDDCVEDGTIVGDGPGNGASADGRLNALLNQLDAVEDLIQEGFHEQACEQLAGLYKKTDGLPKPPDFVSGESAAVLSRLILDLMASIGCAPTP